VQRSELTADEMKRFSSTDEEKNDSTKGILSPKIKIKLPMMEQEQEIEFNCLSSKSNGSPTKAATSALSPRRKRAREREKLVKKVVKVVSSPLPYCILGILLLMVILIFVNVMPIAGLICVIAIVMVLFIVMGNRWKDSLVWEEDSHHTHRSNGNNRSRSHTRNNSMTQVLDSAVFSNSGGLHSQVIHTPLALQDTTPPTNHPDTDELGPLTHEDKIDNLNEFFEDLFHSIDYSLLLIFLGTFIVVENMASTGIPRIIFKSLVGPVPFKTIYSIFGISCFVLIASQLLGNVAVVQLAKPNVHELNEEDKRFAWALISFISTIGGNLTIAGSAANIIVAEKANRLDAMINFNFFRHHKVCFWITLACCLIGGTILALIVMVDNSLGSKW
jgi:Na+/H+ antiporter NhaD/arsenite permease-like protein